MPRLARRDLTDARITAIKPPRTGRVETTDRAVRGLCFAVSASGVRSWILTHTSSGRRTRTVLGHFPDMTLKDARLVATAAKDGPAARQKSSAAASPEFGQLAESYIARGMVVRSGPKAGKPLSRAREIEGIIRREILPHWGHREVTSLTKKDATALTDAIVDRGAPQMANRVHETYRRIMNWAVKRGEIEVSPFALMDLPTPKVMRDRVLAPEEIKNIWEACYRMGNPWGSYFRLLILAAQRRSEVSDMTWAEIDLDAKLWIIPASRTKNGLPHECPLSSLAVQEIGSLRRHAAGDYVFSTQSGRHPISGFTKSKKRLDGYSGVTGWRIHDIRRTVRTGLSKLKVPQVVAERVLNHVERNALVRTYDLHEFFDEKADALELWAGHIRDLVSPPPGNVVRLA